VTLLKDRDSRQRTESDVAEGIESDQAGCGGTAPPPTVPAAAVHPPALRPSVTPAAVPPSAPFVIGLTGSIGTGKTTTAAMFRRLQIPVHESDQEVHHLLKHDQDVIKEVAHSFPTCVLSGQVDRFALGNLVFETPRALKKLEDILHPKVRARHKAFIKKHQDLGTSVVVLDVPLLFEANYALMCDTVIVTTCPPDLQKERVLQRAGMTLEKFSQILKSQLSSIEKQQRGDSILDTSHGQPDAFRQLRLILKNIGF
jgi:dephospho-CoA kinase